PGVEGDQPGLLQQPGDVDAVVTLHRRDPSELQLVVVHRERGGGERSVGHVVPSSGLKQDFAGARRMTPDSITSSHNITARCTNRKISIHPLVVRSGVTCRALLT